MKKMCFLLVMLCSVCAFMACSDDDKKEDPTPVCPVTNVSLDKTVAKVGDEVVLSGEGFAVGAKLYLKGKTTIAISDLTIAADGKKVTFTVPEAEAGEYKLLLQQNGDWTLEVKLTVEKVVVKKLVGMTVNFTADDPLNFKMKYTEGKITSVVQKKPDATEYDYFTFVHSQDSVYITVDPSGTFSRSLGVIVVADNKVTSFGGQAWTYREGYLEKAVVVVKFGNQYETLAFENGNMVSWSMTESSIDPKVYSLKYEGNRPAIKGIDAGLFVAQLLYGTWRTPLFVAQLLGLSGEISANLPSAIIGSRLLEEEQITCNITAYEVDTDGYITKVTVDDKLKYNQELIVTFTWE